MKKDLKGLLKRQYILLYYYFRKSIKWKRINSVYLKIDEKQISKNVFGNIVYGDYEIDENKILHATLAEEDVLLELGTGLGFNSISASKINNNKVVTFEGNPNLIPVIKENMKRNNVDFCLRNEIVLSKNFENKSFSFNVVDDFWSSSLKSNINGKIVEKAIVQSCDVNDVIREVNPTFLMVDIEGGEEDFFEDCSFLKRSSIKKILLELHADIIGEEKCSMVVKNIIESGFKLSLDSSPKNVMYFFR